MGRIQDAVRKHLKNLQTMYNQRLREIREHEQLSLACARTRNEREMVKLRTRQEKAKLDKELAEARIATRKAEAATKKARIEAGDLSAREQFEKGLKTAQVYLFGKPKRTRKRTVKRTTSKRTTAKKTTTRSG